MHTIERFHLWLGVQAVGVGLVVAALWWAAVGRTGRSGGRVAAGAAVAAALLVARHYAYATPVIAGAAVVALVGAASHRADWPVVGLMATTSLAGVWAAVPDTEAPLIVLGAVAAPALVGWLAPTLVVDRLAAIAVVVGAAWVGSAGRSEMLGGFGCVGLLCTLPAFPAGNDTGEDGHQTGAQVLAFAGHGLWWRLLVAHTIVVAISARVLTRTSTEVAGAGLVAVVIGSLVAGVMVDGRVGRAVSERGSRAPGNQRPRR